MHGVLATQIQTPAVSLQQIILPTGTIFAARQTSWCMHSPFRQNTNSHWFPKLNIPDDPISPFVFPSATTLLTQPKSAPKSSSFCQLTILL
jgi:hypothetical protein